MAYVGSQAGEMQIANSLPRGEVTVRRCNDHRARSNNTMSKVVPDGLKTSQVGRGTELAHLEELSQTGTLRASLDMNVWTEGLLIRLSEWFTFRHTLKKPISQ